MHQRGLANMLMGWTLTAKGLLTGVRDRHQLSMSHCRLIRLLLIKIGLASLSVDTQLKSTI
jgi:hypothetical protein